MALTDDEAITLSAIHFGKSFYRLGNSWWTDLCAPAHPIEKIQGQKTGVLCWRSLEQLAHDYCAYYKLDLEPSET